MLAIPRELFPKMLGHPITAARFGATCTAARSYVGEILNVTVTESGAKMTWCGAENEILTSKNVIAPPGKIACVNVAAMTYNMEEFRVRTSERHHTFDTSDLLMVIFCRKVYYAHKKMLPVLRQFSAEVYAPAAKWLPFEEESGPPPRGPTPILYSDDVVFADYKHARCIVLRRI